MSKMLSRLSQGHAVSYAFRDILGFEMLFCAVYLVLVSIGLWFW